MDNAPEVGQTVIVRGRPYLVEGSCLQMMPDTTLVRQHVVHLACLDENSLDERLAIVWELEPGAAVKENSSLPSMRQFDDPDDLIAFIHAVRWGIISQMEQSSMQAPFRSGVEPEDYQLEPVAKALTMSRVNLLLADDVGLGKTIEAGLVMQELMLRNRVNTVLVVCPASLQFQWRDEMRDKFGLDFRIINSETVSQLRRKRGIHVNPWTHYPKIITSIDYLKQDRVFQRFCETLPPEGESRWPRRYDLLIVDEAHNIAPAGTLHYAKPSLRTKIIRHIGVHFEHRMFLTATPHNGYRESFSALLELLDNQRFVRSVLPSPERLGQVMIRRMKSEIKNFDGSPRFPRREIHALEVPYTDEEYSKYSLFRIYARLCRNRLRAEVSCGSSLTALEFVLTLLKKRLVSSPLAFHHTLEKHIANRKKQLVSFEKLHPLILPDLDDSTEEEVQDAVDDAFEQSSMMLSAPSVEEQKILCTLQQWAQHAASLRDSKADRLLRWLDETLRPQGVWNETRVVIFTEYRDTQDYLAELFNRAGLGGNGRLICLNGSISQQDRETAKAAFQADPKVSPVRILLGTDAASEGINLQNHCSRLIHYEIPWNPSRLEQRNGRIDRHGQNAPVVDIFHFVAAAFEEDLQQGTKSTDLKADLEFLQRIVHKVENIRLDLGKVGPVIARQVEKAMLSTEQAPSVLDTTKAELDAAAARRTLKLDRDLRKILEDVRVKLDNTKNELLLTPQNIQHVVSVALRLARQPQLIPTSVQGIPQGNAFMLPAFSGAWAGCMDGNAHPYTGAQRPVVFNGDDAKGRDDVVLLHLNHRLVSMSLRLLRAQLWASELDCNLHRAATRIVPSSLISEPVVVVLGRIIVVGGTNQRIFEEMIMAGGRIRAQRFSRMGVQELERFWSSAMAIHPAKRAESWETGLRDNLWDSIKTPLYQALEARCEDRLKTLESRMERRVTDEVARFEAVMDELGQSIQAELKRMQTPQQLSLLDMDERETFNADVAVLEQRLRRIPEEKAEEVKHLRARYSEPRQTLFPLAVLWFIPASISAQGGR